MAYTPASAAPFCVSQGIGGGPKVWFFAWTDAVTAVRVSGYLTDGYSRGLRKNDLLFYIKTDASPLTIQAMIVNQATKSGSTETVDLSDGTAIDSTDSD